MMEKIYESDLKIMSPEDCGNAPKKGLLKELSIAFAKNDIEIITEMSSEHIYWNIIGEKLVQGKAQFIETLNDRSHTVTELHIQNIITHGREGAINGTLILTDKKHVAFCDIYKFTNAGKNAKIKEITSYLIEIDSMIR